MITPLHFKTVHINYPILLAPMAGYTDCAMRTLCLEHGAGAVYSELTSAEGLKRNSQATFRLLDTWKNESPIAGHIFGRDPKSMAEAAKKIEQTKRFDWVDINAGCPVKKVVSRGAGAALLKDLPSLEKIIRTVKKSISLPVSVKTRIGFNPSSTNHLEIAQRIQDAGADMIAVHARFAKDFHSGKAHWEKLGEMKQMLSIPLVGNGGIQSIKDAEEKIKTFCVDGVMIGRGAIGNPWVFKGISSPSLKIRQKIMEEHLRRLLKLNKQKQANDPRPHRYTPETAACVQFRTHIPYYVQGMFNKKQLLIKLAQLTTIDALLAALNQLFDENHSS